MESAVLLLMQSMDPQLLEVQHIHCSACYLFAWLLLEQFILEHSVLLTKWGTLFYQFYNFVLFSLFFCEGWSLSYAVNVAQSVHVQLKRDSLVYCG